MEQIKNKITGEVILEVESLFDADLRRADLSNADLRRADLRGVDLRGADLSNADLYYADLGGADLMDADLFGAYLVGADLSGADLSGAYLIGADLRLANNYYSFVAYTTSRRLVHCFKNDTTWMVRAGCFWGTLEELEIKVLDTHKSSVYLANIEILKTI